MKSGGRHITPRNFSSLLSFSFGSQRPLGAASGLPSGKRQHNPIVVTKQKDSASPLIFRACCTNETLRSIVISLLQNDVKGSGGRETPFATITLTDASISKYKTFHGLQGSFSNNPRHTSTTAHTNETEEFELTFSKITFLNLLRSKGASDDWSA